MNICLLTGLCKYHPLVLPKKSENGSCSNWIPKKKYTGFSHLPIITYFGRDVHSSNGLVYINNWNCKFNSDCMQVKRDQFLLTKGFYIYYTCV